MLGTVLDHLWQSTVFLVGAGLLTLILRNNGARLRFWLWFAASIKFLVPFAALTALSAYLLAPVAPQLSESSLLLMQPAAQPFSAPSPVITIPAASEPNWQLLLLLLWGTGSAAIIARWFIRWSRLRSLLRVAVDIPLSAPVPVKMAPSSLEPGLVGIWKPVILLPQGIAERLSGAEMTAIIAHEICHFRRRDNVCASLHMLVEAMFWYYPLVWWLGARLNAERERACDEDVVASGNEPQVYAESILKVCKLYLHSPLSCVSSVSGSDLKKRMESIVENKFAIRLNTAKKCMLAICASVALIAPMVFGLLSAPSSVASVIVQSTDTPRPGTEAALRRQIEGWERKRPAFEDMTPSYAATTREQQTAIQAMINGWGPLKSITFKEKGPIDGDAYLVEFEHGSSVWTVQPLLVGKIQALSIQIPVPRTDNGPAPGVEAAVRRYYDGFLNGVPAYDIMGPGLITVTTTQLANLEQDAKNLGTPKTLVFTKINAQGWDVYAATFTNGTMTWVVRPLIDGKLTGILWTDIHIPNAEAHPGTEVSLRRYIESLEKGQPNYDEMAPSLAAAVKQQLPGTSGMIKSLGALKTIAFKGGGGGGGADVYDVTFEHGKVEWFVGPLASDGKVNRRWFHQLS